VKPGERIARATWSRRRSTQMGELALGQNMLVASCLESASFRGLDLIPSAWWRMTLHVDHIEERRSSREHEARAEEIRANFEPVRSQLSRLDESGMYTSGAEVEAGDVLVGG